MSRKLIYLVSFILVLGLVGTNAAFSATLERSIADDNDDVEEHGAWDNGKMESLTSSDLEMPYEDKGMGEEQIIGLRYTNIAIPKGAIITSAWVQFQVDETKDGTLPVNLIIEGELSPDAAPFERVAYNVTSRARTTAQVQWSVPNWTTVGDRGPDQATPDISSIIQEIVNQADWQIGNSLVLIISDDPANPSQGIRCAEAGPGNDAALLHIEVASAGVEIWREAESADTIAAPMQISADPLASNGEYIAVAPGNNSTGNPPDDGLVTYVFDAPEGTYKVVGRVIAPSGSDDSFWVNIPGAVTSGGALHSSGWVRWSADQGSDWHWAEVESMADGKTVYFTLAAGTHTLEIRYREDGTLLDALLITDDLGVDKATLPPYLPSPKAQAPDPPHGAKGVALDAILSWYPGTTAATHDVYFGTSSPPPFVGNVAEASYDPGPLEEGATYYWQVDEVEADGVTKHTGSIWSFKTPRPGTGTILREVWLNIGGGQSLSVLRGNPNFPDNPSYSDELTSFEAPINFANNFGSRIHGYLHPETSGDYKFWIASDDHSELWLSTDENPRNATLISKVTNWTPPRAFDDSDVVPSEPIYLEGGKTYYIKALYKEGGGGDNCAVAWQGPDSPTRQVISGYYLSPAVPDYVVVDDFEAYDIVPVAPPTEQVEVVPGSTVVATPPDPASLLMHWACDGFIPQLTDSSGKGMIGFLVGASRTAPGYDGTGGALQFAGTGDHAIGVITPNGLDAFSLSLWVKSNATDTDAGFIHHEDPAGNDDRGMRYDKAGYAGGGTNVVKIGVTSTGGLQQLESSSNVQTTEWQHLVMTWSSGNQLALYVDGVLDSPTYNDPATTGTLTGYNKFYVGKGAKDDQPTESWNGLIDDIRIYNTALTYGQVRSLAGKGDLQIPPVLGPLRAHYEFEGNTNDSSGNGYDGVPQGGPTYAAGVIGDAIELDGVDDYVVVGSVGISGKDPRTIAGWVKASTTSITDWTNIFGFTSFTGSGGLSFDMNKRGGQNQYCIHVYGWERNIMEIDLEWHHLAGTYDGTTITWYGDGQLVGSENRDLNTTDNVQMGKRAHAAGGNFPGMLDDVRIYDYALSPAEVASLGGFVPTNVLSDTWLASGNAASSLELGAVHWGKQAMRVDYDGAGGSYDGTVTRDAPFADLTTGDAKALSVWFRGEAGDVALQNWEAAAAAAAPGFLATNVADGLYDIGQFSGDITYEFVVRSNPDETEASMCLIGRRQFGDTQAGLKFDQWNNTGEYGATIFGVVDLYFGVANNPGVDTHLAFVSSEASGTTALYVNGVYQASVDRAITLSGLVGIGYGAQGEDGSGRFDDFDGDIYGVAIYDTALSDAEIQAHSDAYFIPTPATLSVTLTDADGASATVEQSVNVNETQWQVWNIALADFAGVNVANVSKIGIGLTGTGTSAVMYFDDIRTYKARCMPELGTPVGDLNNDCVVDYRDVEVMAQDWGPTTLTYTITANGADIWGSADAFHYMYQEMTGDGEMIARVTSVGGPSQNGWRKAGAMIRDTLDAGSRNAFVAITGGSGNGGTFQWRADPDVRSYSSRTLTGISPPASVKIVRQGDTFTGYIFQDGQWKQQGDSTTVVMTDPVYIGLAVTSHEASQMTTCTFDNVSINGNTELQLTSIDIGNTLPGTGDSAMIPSPADLNADGAVDWDDLAILLNNYFEEQLWP